MDSKNNHRNISSQNGLTKPLKKKLKSNGSYPTLIEHEEIHRMLYALRFTPIELEFKRDVHRRTYANPDVVMENADAKAMIYQTLAVKVLSILNDAKNFKDSIQRVLTIVKQATACDAAGIRLKSGEDFPYFLQNGFSADFLLKENFLAARDTKGGLCRNSDGTVKLECTCGLVISGKTDPSNPMYTEGGSAWTNDSSQLHFQPEVDDFRYNSRNYCIITGYASIALIPIFNQKNIVGLLQLVGREKGLFTIATIHSLEGIAARIGEALMRKQAEEERERLLSAVEQCGEAIVITDPEGIIKYVNPAFEKATGYLRTDAIGHTPRILKSGKQDEAFYRQLWSVISQGHVFRGQMVNKRKDGTLYTEEATISPVIDDAGNIVNYVAVKRDLTEQLRLSAQLMHSQKMESVGRLAGGVAHDFNNMLGTILANVEVALDDMDPTEPIFACLKDIQTAAQRSAALTRQLLTFSRKQTVAPRLIDLNESIENLLKILRRLIGENIHLDWRPGKALQPVKIDPSHIDQILANLSINARDAITGNGQIIIETENVVIGNEYSVEHPYFIPGKYVMLVVKDNGSGMDKATLGNLFEPFFTTKKEGEGTGLGLATVYGIVKQNGGFIIVDSEPGQGTCFRIYLPGNSGNPDLPRQKKDTDTELSGKETILLVEDETMLLGVIQRQLQKLGYKVLAAETPEKAMRIASDYPSHIHLLITDVVMPEMDGPVLSKKLKRLRPEIKCLFMSGYTAKIFAYQDELDKNTPFIEKPFAIEVFAAKVRETLRLS